MDACYNVGLSGKLFCFIIERGLDRDNDTERQRNKKRKREMGKMEAVKWWLLAMMINMLFRQNEMHANISVP